MTTDDIPPEITINNLKLDRITYLLAMKIAKTINEDLQFNSSLNEILTFIISDWTKSRYMSSS